MTPLRSLRWSSSRTTRGEPEVVDASKMTPDELRELADRKEAEGCSGLAASWCPVHGYCSCPEEHQFEWPSCPLHGVESSHAN